MKKILLTGAFLVAALFVTSPFSETEVHSIYDANDSLVARRSVVRVFDDSILVSVKDSNHMSEAYSTREYEYDGGRLFGTRFTIQGALDSSFITRYAYDENDRVISVTNYLQNGEVDPERSRAYTYEDGRPRLTVFDSAGAMLFKAWNIVDSCGAATSYVVQHPDSSRDTTRLAVHSYGLDCGTPSGTEFFRADSNSQSGATVYENGRISQEFFYARRDTSLESVITTYAYPDSGVEEQTTVVMGPFEDTVNVSFVRIEKTGEAPVRRTERLWDGSLSRDIHWTLNPSGNVISMREFGIDSVENFSARRTLVRDSLERVTEVIQYDASGSVSGRHVIQFID